MLKVVRNMHDVATNVGVIYCTLEIIILETSWSVWPRSKIFDLAMWGLGFFTDPLLWGMQCPVLTPRSKMKVL